MDNDFNLFKDWPEEKQNFFLKEYLTDITKYLVPFEFPTSKGYFYYTPHFRDQQFHDNSIKNLAGLMLLLISRDFLLPIKFVNNEKVFTNEPQDIYFIFTDWPIGDLSDDDFDSLDVIPPHEFKKFGNILAN